MGEVVSMGLKGLYNCINVKVGVTTIDICRGGARIMI
jgi:hypothetical protein